MVAALQPAHSSWIAFHGYKDGFVTVITKTGESYVAAITESRYHDFLKAPSPGAYFNMYIKPFAKVSRVDVTEDVALVERAKEAVRNKTLVKAIDDLAEKINAAKATPTKVQQAPRRSPAKTKLPHKPWDGKDSAWIDFRCIGDPTTGPELVKALKRFIALKGKGKDKDFNGYLPYTSLISAPPRFGIAALDHWGTGYVDTKYLKAMPEDVTDYVGLANSYRSAYRSWVKRQAVKANKVKVDVLADAFKEVFAGGLSGAETPTAHVVTPTHVKPAGTIVAPASEARIKKALEDLIALENGQFFITIDAAGTTRLNLIRGSLVFAAYVQRR